jgi:hypothetical protein
MTRLTICAFALFVVCTCCTFAATAENALTPEEQQSGWKLLFDGKSTNGWRSYKRQDLSDGWVVEDGTLRLAKPGVGDIVTKDNYDNFELSLDYNISPGGNSGIIFHAKEDVQYAGESGPEVQVFDNPHDPKQQQAGWLYDMYQSPIDQKTGKHVDATNPAGKWNHVDLLVTDQKCDVKVNDVSYYQFTIGSPDWNERLAKSKFTKYPGYGKTPTGPIILQDHGNLVSYRNIKVRVLNPDGTPKK